MIRIDRPSPQPTVADLLLDMERAVVSAGGPVRAVAPSCRAIRQSDEVYCPGCGLRWTLGDDRPECPSLEGREP